MKIKIKFSKIADQRNLPKETFEAKLLFETEKAICINYTCNGSLNKIWLPKSVINYER